MRKNENEVQALLILVAKDAKQFNALKKQRGIKNNVELLRILIKEAFDRELKEATA